MDNWLTPVLSLLGAVFAGAGLKWLEAWLKRAKDTDDTATNLRNELRGELTALKIEIQNTEKELDEWKLKYFTAVESLMLMRVQLEQAKRKLEQAGLTMPVQVDNNPADVLTDVPQAATVETKIPPTN